MYGGNFMKKITVLAVLLLIICMTLMAQSVTGQTSGLNPTLLRNLQTFARNVNRDINITSGLRQQSDQVRNYNDGLARGGHLSSQCPGPDVEAVPGFMPCDLPGRGGGALHAPRRDRLGWMEISRPREEGEAGGSRHLTGDAADVHPIYWTDCAELNRAGLKHTVSSEEWHLEVAGNGERCTLPRCFGR